MIVGIDVGGTKALCLATDARSGHVLAQATSSSSGSGPELVATLVGLVHEVEVEAGVSALATGVGVAGLVTTGGVVRYSPNLPEIVEFDIESALFSQLGSPVVVANDATVGALAEHRIGAGADCDNLLFVALGTGIGMGLIVDGRLVTGANGFAGEVGHMIIDLNGPAHITGQRGPWEYFASGDALGRLGADAARSGNFDAGIDLAGSARVVTGKHVGAALANGDRQAAIILDLFCANVAVGLANLVMVLDPSRIVVAGGVCEIGEPLRAGIDTALIDATLGSDHRPHVEVVLAALGSRAGAIGAALLASDLLRADSETLD